MKTVNFNDLLQYASTLNPDRDDWYTSEQEMANDFLKGFETWRATKDLPKIALPVRAVGDVVFDANGEQVAECPSIALAQVLVLATNKDYVPTEEQRIDMEAEKLAGNISKAGKRLRREVRVKPDLKDEDWDSPANGETQTQRAKRLGKPDRARAAKKGKVSK